jgi:RND family efflux transporter MFP subunit
MGCGKIKASKLLVILTALSILVSCSEKVKPGKAEIKRQQVTGVTLAQITLSPVDSYYECAGTVKAKATSIISARTMGAVYTIKIREGQSVKAGQTLLLLDDRDAAQRLAAAEAGHNEALRGLDEAAQRRSLAETTFKRYRNLADEKVISPQEMDQIDSQKKVADIGYQRAEEGVNRAKAQLQEARINKGFSSVTAPFSGLITGKKIDEGSLAAPGTPLLVMEDASEYHVDAYLDERMGPKVKVGMAIPVVLTADNRQIMGKLGEIVHAVDPASRTFLVKIFLKDGTLRSGIFVRILVPEGKKQALLVPRSAVVEKGQLSGLYVVDEKGVMTYRIVKLSQTYGDRVEVSSGLRNNERIAVAGLDKAIDGGMVKQ